MPDAAARPPRGLVAVLAVAAFGYGLMQSLVTPLLPVLREEWDIDASQAAWLVSGFLVAACVATPIAGRLGDMFGRARVLRIVLLCFSVASIGAAFAPAYPHLLAARVVQGIGGAVFPLAFGLARQRLSTARLSGAIGIISSMIAVGSGVGQVAVGPIHDVVGTQGVFAVGAVVVGAATVAVWAVVPGDAAARRLPIDVGGAVLLALWTTLVLVVISEVPRAGWGVGEIAAALVAATAFAVWVAVERRAVVPIVNLQLMTTRPVMYANLLALLFGFILFGGMITLPTFVQAPAEGGYGFSATIQESGLYLLPQTAMFLVISLLASRMHQWPGERVCLVAGAVLGTIGQSLLLLLHAEPWQVIVGSMVSGAGVGLVYTHLAVLVVRIVPENESGSASGTNTNIRNIGGSIGAQVTAGVALVVTGAAGYTAVFGILALVGLAAVPVALLLARAVRP
ncbi:MAG: MFS transporter [Candidatus Microbacterium phytovorans]|uniref:MFS transporter n=1 Tax=Candidatus Microbacterium phytovorans TaxID=3121374 RepID=A0AAJ5W2P4_9MICO|nr:MFS transporter [Microbacterium sp.]WEK13457.1 MAG: MFS transporter [Microbacterium sp.]